MPDIDITKMTFLGVKEEIGHVYGDMAEKIVHPWKKLAEEKKFRASTGKPILCWDISYEGEFAMTNIFLGYRISWSKSYSEFCRDDEELGLKVGEFGPTELKEWTAKLTVKLKELGIGASPQLFEVKQTDIG